MRVRLFCDETASGVACCWGMGPFERAIGCQKILRAVRPAVRAGNGPSERWAGKRRRKCTRGCQSACAEKLWVRATWNAALLLARCFFRCMARSCSTPWSTNLRHGARTRISQSLCCDVASPGRKLCLPTSCLGLNLNYSVGEFSAEQANDIGYREYAYY